MIPLTKSEKEKVKRLIDLMKKSHENFKIVIAQRNEAFEEIENLKKENLLLKNKIEELESNPQKEITEIKKQYQDALDKKEKEFNSKIKDFEIKVKDFEKYSDIEKRFKEFIIYEFFESRQDLMSKPLDFVLELYKEKKKFGEKSDVKPKKTEIEIKEGEEICPFCQEQTFNPNFGALQCEDCWKKIKSLAVLKKVGMVEARKIYAEQLGVPNPYENNM